MERLFEIYRELHEAGVIMVNRNFDFDNQKKAVVLDVKGRVGLYIDISNISSVADEIVTITHEWAHLTTGALHHVDADDVTRRKDEARAARAKIERLIPAHKLQRAIAEGYTELWELADYFNMPYDFMEKAAQHYNDIGVVPFCRSGQ